MDSYMLFDSIQFMDWEVVGEETTHELTNGKAGKLKMSNSAWLSTQYFTKQNKPKKPILFRKLQFIIWLEICQLKVVDNCFSKFECRGQ